MRATCEQCGSPQPTDWRSGDLCVQCGKLVRNDVRCYWCVNWVPAGGFCRTCGAAMVARQSFGPARMLKDAGVDRFTIPKMLVEVDPAQVENLDRIYQEQASILARHVDDVLFLERFLFHKWSSSIEEELIAQLPWQPPVLKSFQRSFSDPHAAALARARSIEELTPVSTTRSLATIVRLRLDDFGAFDEVYGLTNAEDEDLRDEAALAMTGWRVHFGLRDGLRVPEQVKAHLRKSPFRTAATLRLGLAGEKVEVPHEAIGCSDPDLAIPAAILMSDVERLRTALSGDALEQRAASRILVRLGHAGSLNSLLRTADDETILEALDSAVMHGKGAPELREVLFDLLENHEHPYIRRRAGQLLCMSAGQDDGLRIVRAANGEKSVIQSLLQNSKLPMDRMEEVCRLLLERGEFSMSTYGFATVAEKGLVGDDFVPRHFGSASDGTRGDLCRFAEIQLMERHDEKLHRFMNSVAFGNYSAEVRKEAWWSLRRCYLRDDPRGENPAALTLQSCKRFFGSPAEFAKRLIPILEDPGTYEHVGPWEDLARILSEASVDALVDAGDTSWQLADAVVRLMRNESAPYTLRSAGPKYLAEMAMHKPWRERACEILNRFRGSDLDHACEIALSRIERECSK